MSETLIHLGLLFAGGVAFFVAFGICGDAANWIVRRFLSPYDSRFPGVALGGTLLLMTLTAVAVIVLGLWIGA